MAEQNGRRSDYGEQHPAPSFYDVTGTMHGVVADLLQVMRAKLGVELEWCQ